MNPDDEIHKYKTRLSELEKTEYKFQLLAASRPVRLASYIKQVAHSPLSLRSNLIGLVKLTKKVAVRPHRTYGRHYSPINNPLPLFKYPNVSVGLLTEEFSSINEIFLQTCNASTLSDPQMRVLSREGGLTFVITDTKALRNKTKLARAIAAHDNGARIVIALSSKNEKIPTRIKKYISSTLIVDIQNTSGVQPFADIYKAEQHSIPRTVPHDTNLFNYVRSPEDIRIFSRNSLNILTQDFLNKISYTDACKILTHLASYYPIIIEGRLPNWVPSDVLSYTSPKQLKLLVDKLMEPYELERYAIKCGRTVVLQYNSLGSANTIFKEIGGVFFQTESQDPTISVIVSTRRAANIGDVIQNIEKQSLQPVEVILMLHGIELTKSAQNLISRSPLNITANPVSSDIIFGDVLNMALDRVTGEYVTKMDDDDIYGENHLLDLYAAFLSSRADIIGKHNNWTYLTSEDITVNWKPLKSCVYTAHLPGATLFSRTSVLQDLKFGHVKRSVDSELLRRAKMRGIVFYSTHKYNFVRVRHSDHTYQKDNLSFKNASDLYHIEGYPASITEV